MDLTVHFDEAHEASLLALASHWKTTPEETVLRAVHALTLSQGPRERWVEPTDVPPDIEIPRFRAP